LIKNAQGALDTAIADQQQASGDDDLAKDESKLLDIDRTKAFMRKATKEPMPFCCVEAPDDRFLLVMGKGNAKALMEKVKKETRGTRATFGTAQVNLKVLVMNLEGKTLPGLEKRVRQFLRDNKPMPADDCSLAVAGVAVDDETSAKSDDPAEAKKRLKEFEDIHARLQKGALKPEERKQADTVVASGDRWAAGNLRYMLEIYDRYDKKATDRLAKVRAEYKVAADANVTASFKSDMNDFAGDLKLRNEFARDIRDQLKAVAEGRREVEYGVPGDIRNEAEDLGGKARTDTKTVLSRLKADDGLVGLVGRHRDARLAMKEIASQFKAVEQAHDAFTEAAQAVLNARTDQDANTNPDTMIEPVMKAFGELKSSAAELEKLLAPYRV
jgi:hypothetical protein